MRLRELRLDGDGAPEGIRCAGDIVDRLQRQAEVVPRHRVIGFERKRGAVFGDGIGFTSTAA